MFVACNTLCFSNEPLESALRHIAELEFEKIDLAIVEDSAHLRPSDVAENPEAVALPCSTAALACDDAELTCCAVPSALRSTR